MRRRRPAALAVLAAACALPVPAVAAPPAAPPAAPAAQAARTVTDAAFVVGVDDLSSPRVTVLATAIRTTVSGTSVKPSDTYVVCLAYRAGRVSESGCVTAPGRPVTAGTGQPEGAVIRARVPVHGRRGGWIEADLRLTAEGLPWVPPASYTYAFRNGRVLGVAVPVAAADAAVRPGVWRTATLSGTVRTDRGLRVRPVGVPDTWVPSSVARAETYGVAAG
jgi:hypothetical protein